MRALALALALSLLAPAARGDETSVQVHDTTNAVTPQHFRPLSGLQWGAPQNIRSLTGNLFGAVTQLSMADTLSSGVDIDVTGGIHKYVVCPTAGTDSAGSVTISGDSISRVTGVITRTDTEVLTIAGLSTNSSTTDTNGLNVYAIADAYISTKWWVGPATLSTADVNFSNVDVLGVAFNQFNDGGKFQCNAVDATFAINNTAGHMSMVGTFVDVTDTRVDMTGFGEYVLLAADVDAADQPFRVRVGGLGISGDGSTDGVLLDFFFGPLTQKYFDNIHTILWCYVEHTGY